MAVYFDASAFFPLFIDDPHSAATAAHIESLETDYALSDLTVIETSSAASRAVRSRRISEEKAGLALDRARQWARAKTRQHEVTRADFMLAETYVRRFDLGLRPGDALHLAICRRLGLMLLTCDRVQAKAAHALGVQAVTIVGGET